MIYLKNAERTAEADHQDVHEAVTRMLAWIAQDGGEAARHYARELDKWSGQIIFSDAARKAAADLIPERLRDDIRSAGFQSVVSRPLYEKCERRSGLRAPV